MDEMTFAVLWGKIKKYISDTLQGQGGLLGDKGPPGDPGSSAFKIRPPTSTGATVISGLNAANNYKSYLQIPLDGYYALYWFQRGDMATPFELTARLSPSTNADASDSYEVWRQDGFRSAGKIISPIFGALAGSYIHISAPAVVGGAATWDVRLMPVAIVAI